MWGHLRAFFFVDFAEVARPTAPLKAIYFLTGFGHQAVMVFFVLSGFLISSSIFRSTGSGTWSWSGYSVSRATRLYVVLIPGLLLGALWDLSGKTLFSATGLYTQPLASFGGTVVQNDLTVGNFFGTLFFLQTIFCHAFGSNGPLWSIANEFWYYVLFPLGVFAFYAWGKQSYRSAILLTVSALGVAAVLGPEKLLGFVVWLSGFAVLLFWSRNKLSSASSRAAYLLVASALLATCMIAARTVRLKGEVSDLIVGLVFSVFLLGILQLEWPVAADGAYLRSARLFAGFSYTLYVLHFPFLLFLRAWILPSERWQPNFLHLLYGLAIGAGVLIYCWLVARFTEHRTGEARRWVLKTFHLGDARPAQPKA
jgi:peptidoglycan/LPS O-acetylase OafA/YrhL